MKLRFILAVLVLSASCFGQFSKISNGPLSGGCNGPSLGMDKSTPGGTLYSCGAPIGTPAQWTLIMANSSGGNVLGSFSAGVMPIAINTNTLADGPFSDDSTTVTLVRNLSVNGSSAFNLSRQPPQLFSVLPTCNTGLGGATAGIIDSATSTWGATVTGTGSDTGVVSQIACNGTNWTLMSK